MVTGPDVIEAIQSLTVQMGEAPSTLDVAAKLGVSSAYVRRIVGVLAESEMVDRVGQGAATRLVLPAAPPPRIQRLRAIIEKAKAAQAAELVADLEALVRDELRAVR